MEEEYPWKLKVSCFLEQKEHDFGFESRVLHCLMKTLCKSLNNLGLGLQITEWPYQHLTKLCRI